MTTRSRLLVAPTPKSALDRSASTTKPDAKDDTPLFCSLQLLDSVFLQLLTKATGQSSMIHSSLDLATNDSALHDSYEDSEVLLHHGILQVAPASKQDELKAQWKSRTIDK
jgi:hypothetical protein